MVRFPAGSTCRASFRPSEFAKSMLAGVTARIILIFSLGREEMYTYLVWLCIQQQDSGPASQYP